MSVESLRREFREMPLVRDQLLPDPIDQFAKWYHHAQVADIRYPHAMDLATASRSSKISSRIVLLRFFDQRGFVFFSGYDTEKSDQIADNPSVALLFSWLDLERQVRITGTAGKISAKESLRFFSSRSRESQIGAWLTQSKGILSSRNVLKMKLAEAQQSFRDKKIPLPGKWGGYRIKPQTMEFWQGHRNGLHARFRYVRTGVDDWIIERLLP